MEEASEKKESSYQQSWLAQMEKAGLRG